MELEQIKQRLLKDQGTLMTAYEKWDLLIKIEAVAKLKFIEESIDNFNKDFISQSNDQYDILDLIRQTILNK